MGNRRFWSLVAHFSFVFLRTRLPVNTKEPVRYLQQLSVFIENIKTIHERKQAFSIFDALSDNDAASYAANRAFAGSDRRVAGGAV